MASTFAAVERRTWVTLAVLAVLALVPVAAQIFGQPYWITVWSRIVIYAIAAVSLDLILGFGGLVSFGHAAYFGLGGYVAGILAFHAAEGSTILGFPGTQMAEVSWPLAVLLSGAAALVLGALCLRTGGVYFIMITLAFAQMVFFLFVSLERYGGDDGLSLARRSRLLGERLDDVTLYYVALACLALALFLCARIVGSRFGMVLRGAKQNERRMAALGFPVYRYRLVAFTIAGALCGLAGALQVNHASFASPDMMAWTKSGELMVMVILGGIGTLIGPVLGAAAFLLLETTLRGLPEVALKAVGMPEAGKAISDHWLMFLGLILLCIILFARRGLYGLLDGGKGGR